MSYPYEFVPYPAPGAVDRRAPTGHDAFEGLSGRFECMLKTVGPVLVSAGDKSGTENYPKRFMKDGDGFFVPGTTLKGLVRSLFEVIVPSCVSLSGGKTRNLLPDDRALQRCRQSDQLCPACRVFGYMGQGSGASVHRGQVNIGEARAEDDPRPMGDVQMFPQYCPRPKGSPHHYQDDQGNPAGRKFYFHHHAENIPVGARSVDDRGWVAPLPAGTRFRFTVTFENLSDRERAGLVAALTLSDAAPLDGEKVAVRHKLGYGKAAGLGSSRISLRRAALSDDAEARYRGFNAGANRILEGGNLSEWTKQQQDRFFDNPTDSVQALIRILRHPPPEGVEYDYPQRHDYY
jgi:CRISPR/Cas system CSM-associated protein Csm3 (group 7 of RAMP superfamily)